MKHEVPFKTQTQDYNCGPANVAMVAEFHGIDCSIERANRIAGFEEKAVTTADLAIALSELGLNVEFFSAEHGFNPENFDEEFYQEHGIAEGENKQLYREMADRDVKIIDGSLSTGEILAMVRDGPLIALLDWNEVTGEEGYHGHFVTVTGFKEKEILIHDADDPEGDFKSIDREVFEKSRKAKGTTEDILKINQPSET